MVQAGADVLLDYDVVEYDRRAIVVAILEAMGAQRGLMGLSFQRKSVAVDRPQRAGPIFLAIGPKHWKIVQPDQ
jgi:hypothetical protein